MLSKALVPVDGEQTVIAKMKSLRTNGALLKDLVAALNDDLQANPTRNGRPWQISTVAAILKRAA